LGATAKKQETKRKKKEGSNHFYGGVYSPLFGLTENSFQEFKLRQANQGGFGFFVNEGKLRKIGRYSK
jgi:hypothetical protein